jgi:glyoxylase-like metal-dependent hydrolase (beta-lactamase superfamily II)
MLRSTAIAFLVLLSAAVSADDKPKFTLHEVGPGVWAAISVPKSGTGGNAGFVVGSDGVLVVDSFQTEAAAQALLEAIRKTTPLPVRYVVDTHYHLDHVGGNGVFAAAGATVMAQANVRGWIRTENLKFFGADPKPEERKQVESLTLPSLVYQDGVTLWLGDRQVIVRVVQGHTGGDSVVVVPDAQVVFAGDLFWKHDLPNLIDADTLQQIETNDTFLKDYPKASFVPGHGDVGTAADVAAFRDYLMALRAAVAAAQSAGKTGPSLMDTVLPGLKQQYADWGYFDYFSKPNIQDTEAELAGKKKRPVPVH